VVFMGMHTCRVTDGKIKIPAGVLDYLGLGVGSELFSVMFSYGQIGLYKPRAFKTLLSNWQRKAYRTDHQQQHYANYVLENHGTFLDPSQAAYDALHGERLFSACTEKGVVIDSEGNFTIPKRARSGFNGEAVIVFEDNGEIGIWDPETLNEHRCMGWGYRQNDP
jgi:bifunctional DNA-binding transcriptional regulator/antitoxin component of YhaV-PrlF toxin-antitoxin module